MTPQIQYSDVLLTPAQARAVGRPTSTKRVTFQSSVLVAEIVGCSDCETISEVNYALPTIRILPPAGLKFEDPVETQSVEPIPVSQLRRSKSKGGLKRERVKFILGGEEFDDADGVVTGGGPHLDHSPDSNMFVDRRRSPLKREKVRFLLGGEEFDNPDGNVGECMAIAVSVGQGDILVNAGLVGRIAWFGAAVVRMLTGRWWR